jgi:hypothetical protein
VTEPTAPVPHIDVTIPASGPVAPSAPAERGWGKLLLALAAFLLLPMVPQLRALLPIDQPMLLFVPAVAACALVGWWAGGRAFMAIAWVAIATLLTVQAGAQPSPFYNLVRGWSLLLAGSFGLVCLFSLRRPLFVRSLLALGTTMALAMIMSLIGPVSPQQASKTVAAEFAQRNAEWETRFNAAVKDVSTTYPKEWSDLSAKVPTLATLPAEMEKELTVLSGWGLAVFPALLALQSLAALALAWATYHRLGRARLGAPLRPLREFRFNDQLVWGLIVGLTIMLVPTLTSMRGAGKNLLVFFGALYAVRGFGVLTWFMAPGSLGITLGVGFVMLLLPFLNVFAVLAFMMAAVASLALGLGDTWADWRSRARPTP